MSEEPTTPSPAERTRPRPQLRTREQAQSAAVETRVSDALSPRPTTVILGGREFTFRRLSFNDLCNAERRGVDLNEALAALNAMSATGIRMFAWLMLQQTDPEITLEEVGELLPIHEDELLGLLNAMVEAAHLEKKGGGAPEADPSTGGA